MEIPGRYTLEEEAEEAPEEVNEEEAPEQVDCSCDHLAGMQLFVGELLQIVGEDGRLPALRLADLVTDIADVFDVDPVQFLVGCGSISQQAHLLKISGLPFNDARIILRLVGDLAGA